MTVDIYTMIRDTMRSSVPFAKHTGIELTHLEPGYATAELDQSNETSNHMGSVHAGAMFTLGETAAGGAVAGTFAPFMMGMKAFPTEMNIHFTKPAKGKIIAKAIVQDDTANLHAALKSKNTVSFRNDVSIYDTDDNEIGKLTSIWQVRTKASLMCP